MFGQAVQAGYYVLQNARDEYRLACGPAGMHQGLVQDYLRVSFWALSVQLLMHSWVLTLDAVSQAAWCRACHCAHAARRV